jgi:hypothetical protein
MTVPALFPEQLTPAIILTTVQQLFRCHSITKYTIRVSTAWQLAQTAISPLAQ